MPPGSSEVWIDPGIGFGKNVQHNLALLGAVDALVDLGDPVLVGTSRKCFLGVVSPCPRLARAHRRPRALRRWPRPPGP